MKRSTRMLALGLFGSMFVGSAAQAKVLWRGDFESGDRSQWSGTEMVSADRLQVVQDPVRQGRFALKARVHQGDNPINASGNRNELFYNKDNPTPGDERYYSWSTLWPSSFESANTWQLFTQFHHTGPNGSPPVEMFTNGDFIFVRVSGNDVVKIPLDKGRWHDFVLHVKWSPKASEGFVELWYDGKLTLPKTYGATLFEGQGVYLKQGLYRNASVSQDQIIYHDGMTVATSLDDVMTAGGDLTSSTPSQGSTQTASNTSTSSTSSTPTSSELGAQNTSAQATAGAGCASTGPGSLAAAFLALLLIPMRRQLGYARRQK